MKHFSHHSVLFALAFMGLAGVDTALAQRQVPPSAEALRFSYAPIARQVSPAVVNVYARRSVERRRSPLFNDPFFERFFWTRTQAKAPG